MELPIDVVPCTDPPRFMWRQVINTPVGRKVVEHMGPLPPSIEGAVVLLVDIAKQLARDNEELKRINQGFADRIAAQSDLLSEKAEAPAKRAKK